MNTIRIGRIQDAVETSAQRILVDRLWPRGVSKEKASWDTWIKDVAPSTELRKWYGHDPKRLEEFRIRYLKELDEGRQGTSVQRLLHIVEQGPVILLTATKDVTLSQLPVLRDFLLSLTNDD